MWPYMLSGLACGSRIILYDGSPLYPDVKTYLRFVDEQKYTKRFNSTLCRLIHLTEPRISEQAPASYQKFRLVESSHGVSAHYLSFAELWNHNRRCWQI